METSKWRSRFFAFVILLIIILAMVIAVGIAYGIAKFFERDLNLTYGIYSKSAVVSDAKPCAHVGNNILLKNGSAVDAAIAVMLCIGIYNPQNSGIGGGTFIVIYDRSKKKAEVIDAREIAPIHSSKDMYTNDHKLSFDGGLAVGVPGELKGLAAAHKKYGRLPWSDLFLPAIDLAEQGFAVGKELAEALNQHKERVLKNPTLKEIFIHPYTGDILKEGDPLKRPILARTLQHIAKKGADEFYSGETGKKFVQDLKQLGGIITEEDLHKYQPKMKNPVVAKLRAGFTLYSVPPPGSGLILSFVLRVIDLFSMTKKNLSSLKESIRTYQRFLEALKYGFAYRTRLGDETFVNLTEVISQLSSHEVIKQTKFKITEDRTFDPKYYGAQLSSDDQGTAHVSVIAPNGDAVSATTTINYWFGAAIRSRSTGIILNNQMDDFSTPNLTNVYGLPATITNFIVPGKRPQSSMCPTIIVNETGDVILAIGAAGGSRIISAVALTTMKILWLNNDIKLAFDEPRIHHQLVPNSIEYEPGFPKDLLKGLEKIGHKLKISNTIRANIVGIRRREDGTLKAAFDIRTGGSVSGF